MSNEEQKSITPGIYLWLIAVNIYISMFAFGGGYVVVPLVRRSFVEKKKIFTEDELMEMSAVAQSSPGAIAVNLAALSGYKAAGTAGAVISCAASVIPPLVILGIISGFYDLFIANKRNAIRSCGFDRQCCSRYVHCDIERKIIFSFFPYSDRLYSKFYF